MMKPAKDWYRRDAADHLRRPEKSGASLSNEFSLLIRRIEISDLAVDSGAATTAAGFPAPIGAKAAPIPADHRLWLDHGDSGQNRGAVGTSRPRSAGRCLSHTDPDLRLRTAVLTEDNVFGLQPRP